MKINYLKDKFYNKSFIFLLANTETDVEEFSVNKPYGQCTLVLQS